MESSLATNLKKEAVVNALIWGAIDIVLFLVVYYAAFNMMASTWYTIGKLVLSVVLAIYFTKDLRTKAGGYWSFSKALKHIFIMFILSAIVITLFTFLFGKVIDTSYPQKMKDLILPVQIEMYEKLGITGEELDKTVALSEAQLEKQFNPSLSEGLVAFGIIGIFYFVGALIFAAIFKKDEPLFMDDEEEVVMPPPVS